jgi:predicted ATP-grasp superfamily ATP-dependent carboligase
LSAARSLGRAGLNVTIAAPPEDLAVSRSRYVSRFVHLDALDDRAVSTLLQLTFAPGPKPFLLATGDEDALLIAKHHDRLAEKFCFVSPSYSVLDAIVDKAKLYATARDHRIRHPRFHVVREPSDIEPAIEVIGVPCYVKPALGHEWRRMRRGKLEKAQDVAELRRILEDFMSLRLTAIPTEIIPGDDSDIYGLSTYIDRAGRSAGWRTKRKIRQYPIGVGDGSMQEIVDEPAVAELGLRLLAITGHRGAATVEFRRDPRDGQFVLMEINVRTVSGQELVTRSGLDVPLIAYHDAVGQALPVSRPVERVRWLRFGLDFLAFRELRRRGTITTIGWLSSILSCRSFAYFAWDDPAPFFARIAMWLDRQLKSRFRRAPGFLLLGRGARSAAAKNPKKSAEKNNLGE